MKLHSDDDSRDGRSRLHGNGQGHGNGHGHGHMRREGSLYPDYSNDAPSLHVHAYPEADPERWDRDSVTLLETGRDDTNAWAKKFTELNRQVEDITSTATPLPLPSSNYLLSVLAYFPDIQLTVVCLLSQT